jgi:hypothetical protein
MSMTTRDQEQAAIHLREEVRRTQQLAHEAIDALDPALAIAHCRALRSLLWRAENQQIDLTQPVTVTESQEGEPVPA